MEEVIQNSILSMIQLMLKALEEGDSNRISEVSNNTIHSASIFQDEDSITIAVIAYALAKISQRAVNGSQWPGFKATIIKALDDAASSLRSGEVDQYRHVLRDLLKSISAMDKKVKLYVQEVIDKAKIKKASAIHEHGISLGRVAELLGISQWELMNYVGKTTFAEPAIEEVAVQQRLKFARRLFGL